MAGCLMLMQGLLAILIQKFSGKFGLKVNGTRLVESFQRKPFRSKGTSEKAALFYLMECSKWKFGNFDHLVRSKWDTRAMDSHSRKLKLATLKQANFLI